MANCNACNTAYLTDRHLVSPCCAQNPALRHELSFEMGQVHSDMALHFGDADNNPGQGDPVNIKPVVSQEHKHCPLKARPEVSTQVLEMLSDALSSRRQSA